MRDIKLAPKEACRLLYQAHLVVIYDLHWPILQANQTKSV